MGSVPARALYTLGAVGKTLTFTNVVTRTKASLTDAGTLAIFIRRRRSGCRPAPRISPSPSAATVGYVSFHRAPSWSNEIGLAIPPEPSGTISWTLDRTGPDVICGLAVSYDDELGLRHFVGGGLLRSPRGRM